MRGICFSVVGGSLVGFGLCVNSGAWRLVMLVKELFPDRSNEEDEISEITLLKEIAYFQRKLTNIDMLNDTKVQTIRHVYSTLLDHRKGLLQKIQQ